METQSAEVPDWPQLNDRALRAAHAITDPDRPSWCLLTCWRSRVAINANWNQHAMLVDGLRRGSRVLELTGHHRVGAITRQEPWIFATDIKRLFAAWLLRRLHQPIVLWGDDQFVHVLTASDPPRCLGEFRPGAIAHAIIESSAEAGAFLGFELSR
jgi:hypothetical protein